MNIPQEDLYNALEDLLRDAENSQSLFLPAEDAEFLIKTLHTFNIEAITKFLKGFKEHGRPGETFANIKSRNLKQETRFEIIDMLMYSEARP